MLAVAAASMVACGGEAPPVSEAAAIELAERVGQVRTDATAGDADAARAGLADVRAAVEELRDRGELAERAGARILAAAADVEQSLALITTTTSPPTTTAPTTTAPTTTSTSATTTTVPDSRDDDDDDDENGGRGGDRGKGKEDD